MKPLRFSLSNKKVELPLLLMLRDPIARLFLNPIQSSLSILRDLEPLGHNVWAKKDGLFTKR